MWDDLGWVSFLSRFWGWRTVTLKFSGFYCIMRDTPKHRQTQAKTSQALPHARAGMVYFSTKKYAKDATNPPGSDKSIGSLKYAAC